MDADGRVVLAEIRGDIKRIFDNHTRYADDMRRIEQNHAAFEGTVNNRLQGHSERLNKLESSNTREEGVRQGVAGSLKAMYIVMGGSGGVVAAGLAAIVARAKGL